MTTPRLKKLIDRYLQNSADEQERRLVDKWYDSYDDTKLEMSPLREQQIRDDIQNHLKFNVHRKVARVRRINAIRYAAAVLLLVGAAAVLLLADRNRNQIEVAYTTIKTGQGQVKKLVLPDGSAVWLNAGSTMRVAEDFATTRLRNVYLDEGEAFFEVKHDTARPFKVITSSITTRVLGTSFNVKAYKRLATASVTVRTGKVQVSSAQRTLALLVRGEQIIFNKADNKLQIHSIDAGNARSWLEGHTILTDASFDELALALNNIYGVKLIGGSKSTTGYKYNVHINSSRTLDETMQVICSVHQNKYRRNKNEVTIY